MTGWCWRGAAWGILACLSGRTLGKGACLACCHVLGGLAKAERHANVCHRAVFMSCRVVLSGGVEARGVSVSIHTCVVVEHSHMCLRMAAVPAGTGASCLLKQGVRC